jgi:hypothetical protein
MVFIDELCIKFQNSCHLKVYFVLWSTERKSINTFLIKYREADMKQKGPFCPFKRIFTTRKEQWNQTNSPANLSPNLCINTFFIYFICITAVSMPNTKSGTLSSHYITRSKYRVTFVRSWGQEITHTWKNGGEEQFFLPVLLWWISRGASDFVTVTWLAIFCKI